MRYIGRNPEPVILNQRKAEWTTKFINSGKDRPDNSKYGHPEIKSSLYSVSHNKCYYCETILKGKPSEIDHYIEVSENKSLAFEWTNLYLSCDKCNDKLPNKSISVFDTLNPCRDDNEEIRKHLKFEDEQITFLTSKGDLTIQKYKLSSERLDWCRMQELKKFYKLLIALKNILIAEKRDSLNAIEKERLKRFSRSDYCYSLMFKDVLNENN
ncbi:MAG: HNH endonuclease [Mariniphaga sp.]